MFYIDKMNANTLFNIPTSAEQLSSSNQGISKVEYEQIAPSRSVASPSFSSGTINYRFQVSGQKHWIPSKSYMRLRYRLQKADDSPLTLQDHIAPSEGMCSHLFQSMSFNIADKTVCRAGGGHVAAVDKLSHRMNKSQSWLESTGASNNYWDMSFKERQGIVCRDYESSKFTVVGSHTQTYAYAYLPGQPNSTITIPTADLPTDHVLQSLEPGNYIRVNTNTVKGSFLKILGATIVAGNTLFHVEKKPHILSANVAGTSIEVATADDDYQEPSRKREHEITWVPPLSVFTDVKHALPAGAYNLEFVPQSTNQLALAAIEQVREDAAAKGLADFKFEIIDFFLYIATCYGPRSDDLTYLLDLTSTNCQVERVKNKTLTQYTFDVSPATTALTLAFQDLRAPLDPRFSETSLTAYTGSAETLYREDLKLSRFFMTYAGCNFPGGPDADTRVSTKEEFMTQRYLETQLQTGAYEDAGGSETLRKFISNGPFYHYQVLKDGTDRSTRVAAHIEMGTLEPEEYNGANTNLLLFSHYKMTAQVSVREGRVVNVIVAEQ